MEKEGAEPIHNDIHNLRDKIKKIEANMAIAEERAPGDIAIRGWERSRIIELETEQNRLLKQIHHLEENARNYKKEVDVVDGSRNKTEDKLNRLIKDHDALKNKSLELLKRNNFLETKITVSETEKAKLMENVQKMQFKHNDDIRDLKSLLDTITQQMYLVKHDTLNRRTFMELDENHATEKKEILDKVRTNEDEISTLRDENEKMDNKLYEQHIIIEELSETIQKLEKDVKRLTPFEEEAYKLREDILEVTRERDEATEHIRGLEREIDILKNDKDSLVNISEALQRDKREKENIINDLQGNLQNTESQLESLKIKHEALDQEKRLLDRSAQMFKNESLKTTDVLKLSKEELSNLSKNLTEKTREVETLIKERDFLKYRLERTESQLFNKEKQAAREEIEKTMDQEARIRGLIEENDRLKEDLIGSFEHI